MPFVILSTCWSLDAEWRAVLEHLGGRETKSTTAADELAACLGDEAHGSHGLLLC